MASGMTVLLCTGPTRGAYRGIGIRAIVALKLLRALLTGRVRSEPILERNLRILADFDVHRPDGSSRTHVVGEGDRAIRDQQQTSDQTSFALGTSRIGAIGVLTAHCDRELPCGFVKPSIDV